MGELDDLLSQLKTEYGDSETKSVSQPPRVPPKPADPSVDRLLAQLEGEREDKPQSSRKIPSHSRLKPLVEPSLQEVRSQYQEQDRIAAEHQQQEVRERQQLEEKRLLKKQEALREKAQFWLKQLNPKSDEGRWFEEFSYSFDSKVEAAMHYLEALRESGTNI